jgi:hypothetical protein
MTGNRAIGSYRPRHGMGWPMRCGKIQVSAAWGSEDTRFDPPLHETSPPPKALVSWITRLCLIEKSKDSKAVEGVEPGAHAAASIARRGYLLKCYTLH